MSRAFEQLDCQMTSMGEISLRRRLEPTLLVDVFEVKLGDEFLMSSLFTTGEEAVAHLGLAELAGNTFDQLDVVVGGLGLGHTARAALLDQRVTSLHVVDSLAPVIGWHRDHIVPLGETLTADERCRFVHGDFFAMVAEGFPFGEDGSDRFHAILVDIDHTPSSHLNPSHADFYRPEGLQRLVDQLHPAGVFALWSDAAPDQEFKGALDAVFDRAEAHIVTFPNHYTGGESASTVYVATT